MKLTQDYLTTFGHLYDSGVVSTKTLFELCNGQITDINFNKEPERLYNEIDTIFDDKDGRIQRGLQFLNCILFS
jgi:hypothetical protein